MLTPRLCLSRTGLCDTNVCTADPCYSPGTISCQAGVCKCRAGWTGSKCRSIDYCNNNKYARSALTAGVPTRTLEPAEFGLHSLCGRLCVQGVKVAFVRAGICSGSSAFDLIACAYDSVCMSAASKAFVAHGEMRRVLVCDDAQIELLFCVQHYCVHARL